MHIFLALTILLSFRSEMGIRCLRNEFIKEVGSQIEIDSNYQSEIFQDALNRIEEAKIDQDQYFLYVDRNPEKQIIFVCFYDSKNKIIKEVGRDKVSTGNPKKGKDYFITPVGVFRNTVKNGSYRALGTKNKQGWRGLGKKGARAWDFGWQKGYKTINSRNYIFIRLLLHATDPDYGEQRLGKPDSKGCIRISGKLNEFLDKFGIIDRDYEKNKHWVLRKDRRPVLYQGEYLIVGDSGQKK